LPVPATLLLAAVAATRSSVWHRCHANAATGRLLHNTPDSYRATAASPLHGRRQPLPATRPLAGETTQWLGAANGQQASFFKRICQDREGRKVQVI
jgi:hypothetical protein